MLQPRFVFLISIIATFLLCCAPNNVNSYAIVEAEPNDNNTPIVGILTQEVPKETRKMFPDRKLKSYIAASYVKFVESAGARVVPIWIDQSPEYYKDIVTKLNGVLFPGGGTGFNRTHGYVDAGQELYKAAIELNENGTYFPVWGTCLGFELLTFLEANRTEHRSSCSSYNQPLPLEFKEAYKESRMFGNAPADIISLLKEDNVTQNNHKYCVTQKTFTEYGFDKDWTILSVNHDWNNLEFISSMEHKRYPFYGIQFHPEKNLFEFSDPSIPHSMDGVRVAQYFADLFNSETRHNINKFKNSTEEENSFIYNYKPDFTGKKGSAFIQQYLFDKESSASASASSISFIILCTASVLWSFKLFSTSIFS